MANGNGVSHHTLLIFGESFGPFDDEVLVCMNIADTAAAVGTEKTGGPAPTGVWVEVGTEASVAHTSALFVIIGVMDGGVIVGMGTVLLVTNGGDHHPLVDAFGDPWVGHVLWI